MEYQIPDRIVNHIRIILNFTEDAYIGGSVEDLLLLRRYDRPPNDLDVWTYDETDVERLIEVYGEPIQIVRNKPRAKIIGEVTHLYKFKYVDVHHVESTTFNHQFMNTRYNDLVIKHHTLESKREILKLESEYCVRNKIPLHKLKSIERVLKTENKLL